MVTTGIIKGYPEDNTFRPHLSATRGMASAMLNLMLDKIGGGETPVETKNYVLLNDAGKVVERYTTYKEAVTAAQSKRYQYSEV